MAPVIPSSAIKDAVNAAQVIIDFIKVPGRWVKSYYGLVANATDKKDERQTELQGIDARIYRDRQNLHHLIPESSEKEINLINDMIQKVETRRDQTCKTIQNAGTKNFSRVIYPMIHWKTKERMKAIGTNLDRIEDEIQKMTQAPDYQAPILNWISGYVDENARGIHEKWANLRKQHRHSIDCFKENKDFLDWIELKTGVLVCYGDNKHHRSMLMSAAVDNCPQQGIVLYFYFDETCTIPIETLLGIFVRRLVKRSGVIPQSITQAYKASLWSNRGEPNLKCLVEAFNECCKTLEQPFWTVLDAIERIDGHRSNDVVSGLRCLREMEKCKLLVSVTEEHLNYLVRKTVFEETCKRIAVDSIFRRASTAEESTSFKLAGRAGVANHEMDRDGNRTNSNIDAVPEPSANANANANANTQPKASTEENPGTKPDEEEEADENAQRKDRGDVGEGADATPDANPQGNECEGEDAEENAYSINVDDDKKENADFAYANGGAFAYEITELDDGQMIN